MSDNVEYISFRLRKANEAYRAATLLHENGFDNDAISKLYYAAFYAVNALLASKNLFPKTHNGVRGLFSKEFIVTKQFDVKYVELYNLLLAKRFEVDYDEFSFVDIEKLPNYFIEINNLIEEITKKLTN